MALRRTLAGLLMMVIVAGSLAVVATPTSAQRDTRRFAVANAGSLSDIGTAASVVAAGEADAVLFAASSEALGPDAAGVVKEHGLVAAVLVGGFAALGNGVEDDLRRLSSDASLVRLWGYNRIHTASLAASVSLDGLTAPTVVIANGWSLSDVGVAASIVATGGADAVLYATVDELGVPTRRVIAAVRPSQALLIGGTAALAESIGAELRRISPGIAVERLGGATRVDTAAISAERAFGEGATHAVVAYGWSDRDVGIAVALAAADPHAAVLYAQRRDALGEAAAGLLTRFAPERMTLVGDAATVTPAVEAQAERRVPTARVRRLADIADPGDPAGDAARAALTIDAGDAFVSVSYSYGHTCGLRADGRILCWGANDAGQSDPRHGTFSAIAAGSGFNCAVQVDESIGCWGKASAVVTEVPDGSFRDVSAAVVHACGLRTDGRITCWGGNHFGQTDSPSGTFASVSAGGAHSCGLRTDGRIACWGTDDASRNQVPSGMFKTVSGKGSHSCGVRSNGSLVCWGRDSRSMVTEVPAGRFVAALTTHTAWACGLHTDGRLECWVWVGSPRTDALPSGPLASLGEGDTNNRLCGVLSGGGVTCWGVGGFNEWGQSDPPGAAFSSVSAGYRRTCALRVDQSLVCWGDALYEWEQPPEGGYVDVSVGWGHYCGVRLDGTVVCGGSVSRRGEANPPDGHFSSVTAGVAHTCGVKTTGAVACWGENVDGRASPPHRTFVDLDAGGFHTCGVTDDEAVVCWGNNDWGQTDAPAGVFTSVAAGVRHSCALRADETIVCWGASYQGETDAPSGAFVAVSADGDHSCGLHTGGRVSCWGANQRGQTEAPWGLFLSAEAGGESSCGVRRDGTISCWGSSAVRKP